MVFKLDAIVPHISRKVLTEQLKELEEDGLLERWAYQEIPPRVEYKLSEKGLAFLPILENIKEWNLKYEIVQIAKEPDYKQGDHWFMNLTIFVFVRSRDILPYKIKEFALMSSPYISKQDELAFRSKQLCRHTTIL